MARSDGEAGDAARATARDRSARAERSRVTVSRAMFYSHLWLGVILTVVLLVISVTGILLNHKRGLGLMPDIENSPSGPFPAALSLSQLADSAFAALGMSPDVAHIDRMDARPRDGLVKIRMRDSASTEVTLDINSGAVLHVGGRGDSFLERLHSGEIFGANGVLLSDFGAVGLVILLVSGYWLWLKPRAPR